MSFQIVITDEDRRRWDKKLAALSVAPPIPSMPASLPVSEHDYPVPDQRNFLPYYLEGQMIEIDYLDANSAPTHRRVRCGRCFTENALIYLQGFCLERQALREFRLDRVQSLIVMGTGEVFEDARLWLESSNRLDELGDDQRSQNTVRFAFRKVKSAVQILMFLARYDGMLHAAETAVVDRYIDQYFRKPRARDVELKIKGCQRIARGLFPTTEELWDALGNLIEDGEQQCASVLLYIDEIIACDGTTMPAEIDLRNAIAQLVETEISARRAVNRLSGLIEPTPG